ncbi:MAG: flagellar hook-length control protein FliK [Gallionellaceae bacterium]|jgi:flagellar hook-length control protein FliK
MSNLPITTSVPQAAAQPAKPAQATQAAKPAQAAQVAKPTQAAQAAKPAQAAQAGGAAEDGAAQSQSFGDVLARQVADAATPEDAATAKKIALQSADETLAKIKADEVAVAALPADAATALPTDMLAALMPQGMVTAAASASSADAADLPRQTAVEAEVTGLPGAGQSDAAAEATGLPKQAALPAGIVKADPGAGPSAAMPAARGMARDASVDSKKDAVFTNMLATMNATMASKSFDADEKGGALAAAPQPNAAALASMQATAAPLAPAGALPVQVVINTPVTHDNWGDEFNQKVTWLASSKEHSAELHLNPPQLGPMDVVIKVSGDQATALFSSPHAAVREAIEQALPKLREMMADSGIMLGNASVNDQAPRGRNDGFDNKSQNSRGSVGALAESGAASSMSARVSPISRHNGIVDTFA